MIQARVISLATWMVSNIRGFGIYLFIKKKSLCFYRKSKVSLNTWQIIRIFNDCEVWIENSVTSDAEQLSRVTEFSVRTEQPLLILFLAYSFFDNCI